MVRQDVANASDQAAIGQTHVLTPDTAEARRMTTAELWDYTKKVLRRDGREAPRTQKLGALLNLSDQSAKNVLWDVIIHSPTNVNSYIDALIAETLETANKPLFPDRSAKNERSGKGTTDHDDYYIRLRSRSRSPRKPSGSSTEIGVRAADHLHSMQSLELETEARAPTALASLKSFMQIEAGERLEAIAFSNPEGFVQEPRRRIPKTLMDRILKPEEAAAHMDSWPLLGQHGNPKSYAMAAWTNQRFIWVTQFDGSTSLHSAPLRPPLFGTPFLCEMPGHS